MKKIAVVLLFVFSSAVHSGASQSAQIQKDIESGLSREAKLIDKVDKWRGEKSILAGDISSVKMKNRLLEYQNQKYVGYIEKQKKSITDLTLKKKKLEQMRLELEPYLDDVLDRLKVAVNSDLPFLENERTLRLKNLESGLSDYHVNMSEKLRRVLEALQVETEYGLHLDKTESQINIGGKQLAVSMVRLGRLSVLFRSGDGAYSGIWNQELQEWVVLASDINEQVALLEEMAERKRVLKILTLPMGGVK